MAGAGQYDDSKKEEIIHRTLYLYDKKDLEFINRLLEFHSEDIRVKLNYKGVIDTITLHGLAGRTIIYTIQLQPLD